MDVVYGTPYHGCPVPDWLYDGAAIGRLAAVAEGAGFAGFTMTDHPAPSQAWREHGGHDTVDPFLGLAFAAAATSRIRLFTYLVVLPYRNPFHLAKVTASLDALSGGRLDLGVGAGYLKAEFHALGVDWDERNALFDEAVPVLRQAWTGEPVTHQGLHFSARGTVTMPPSPQPGGPPLWIGGNSRLSLRRVVDLGAGWLPLPNPSASSAMLRSRAMDGLDDFADYVGQLHAYAGEQGRPAPDRIMYSMPGATSAEEMDAHVPLAAELRERGATQLVVNAPTTATLAEAEEWIARYADRVLTRL